jgi:hypothetical protein
MSGYQPFGGTWGERSNLAQHTLEGKPARGIPSWMVHTMDISFMEQYVGAAAGDFGRDPEGVYLKFQHKAGACFIDQWIPRNPLTMGKHGYEASTQRGATTGAERIVRDGVEIDSPEAVIEHMEKVVWPQRQREVDTFERARAALRDKLINQEAAIQRLFGPNLLKGPYAEGFQAFPALRYSTYGYSNYFMAYALYPEVMEKDFAQQADLAILKNHLAAEVIVEADLPRLIRLDHDMADSRGALVNIRSLDAIWFPHFSRAIRPFLDAGVRLIWHCDGNLMQMVPRLLDCGIRGFQGFQYEDGMDYEGICRMKDRDGEPLFVIAGVSVTRTLPFGSTDDVRREMRWLVDNGPRSGLMLGPSSSITPGVPHENLRAFIEGLQYYQRHGRQ